uniref:Uncharacterized protein n=1 Tax=Anolis carolinensis TaxID=28377 RepID=A0A803TYE3_ANOCA
MQEQPLQYRILPISQEHHNCSLNSPDPHQACIPSPCKDNDHLGMHKITARGNSLISLKTSLYYCFLK